MMNAESEVLAAPQASAPARACDDDAALRALLHPAFSWTSHRGQRFDRAAYLAANRRGGRLTWHAQQLLDPVVTVVGDTAVLCCVVEDLVSIGDGPAETFTMPVTQTWVRVDGRWLLLAGHAGPRSEEAERVTVSSWSAADVSRTGPGRPG